MQPPKSSAPNSAEDLARSFEDEHVPPDMSAYAAEDWLAFILFWIMGLAVLLQFFTRYVLNDSFAWTEEIATYCNVGVVFIGSAMCVRLNRHIQVDFLYRMLPSQLARVFSTFVDFIRIAFFAYASYLLWRFLEITSGEEMISISLPKSLVYGCAFLGFLLMLFRSIQVAWGNIMRGYSVLERPADFNSPARTET